MMVLVSKWEIQKKRRGQGIEEMEVIGY